MNNLTKLLNEVELAKQKFDAELLSQYPIESVVHFCIMHGQKNLSSGLVVCAGHNAGYLRVLHLEAKKKSRYSHRYVHYTMIAATPKDKP